MADQDPVMLQRYYRERDALNLTVRFENGKVVPLQCVHIQDFSVELGEIEVMVAASDSHTFDQYFESDTGAA